MIKNKIARENIPSGQKFNLSKGGNKLNTIVGTPENKGARVNIKQISVNCIIELVGVLELSKTKTDAMCQKLRKHLGQNIIESNIADKINNMHDTVAEFYDCKPETFTAHESNIIRTVVYATSPSDLIQDVIHQRGLDPQTVIVRVSVDSGQGFLKCIVNVFDPTC